MVVQGGGKYRSPQMMREPQPGTGTNSPSKKTFIVYENERWYMIAGWRKQLKSIAFTEYSGGEAWHCVVPSWLGFARQMTVST